MQIRLLNPFMPEVYVYPHHSVNTPKTPTPSMQVALQPQPFVYPGMQIQHATRLMREVCALRHVSMNTENPASTRARRIGPGRRRTRGPLIGSGSAAAMAPDLHLLHEQRDQPCAHARQHDQLIPVLS